MAKSVKPVETREDPWETGDFGRSLEHAVLVEDEETEKKIDAALHLQMISIRLEKSLIDGFKFIASHNKNIGYQTLMRQALHRFAAGEINRIANQMAAEARKATAKLEGDDSCDDTPKPKAA